MRTLPCESHTPRSTLANVTRALQTADGAALFYTSSHRPESVSLLRQYLLNRLFNRTSGASASTRFPLATRASTVDRDTVFVPSGWDSYGKIKALRGNDDTFDCAAMARAWEIDMEVELTRRARIVQGTPADDPAIQEVTLRSALLGPEATSQRSAVASFEDIVGDWHAREPPLVNGAKVASPDIQEFLSQLYTLLLKEPDAGSRAVGTGTGSGTAGTEADGRKHKNSSAVEVAHDDFTRRTVVGPLAAASLGTLSKFSAEEADPSAAAAVQPKPKSKEKRDRTRSELDALAAPRPSASAVSPSGGPQRQSEVLHDFFKSRTSGFQLFDYTLTSRIGRQCSRTSPLCRPRPERAHAARARRPTARWTLARHRLRSDRVRAGPVSTRARSRRTARPNLLNLDTHPLPDMDGQPPHGLCALPQTS